MPSLGDKFPAEKRRAFVKRHLVPGCVIRINVRFPEKTKSKFLVLVADDDPEIWTFIVNSDIHPYVAARPALLKCQVKITAADHAFLTRDSHLACEKVLHLRREDVIREVLTNIDCIKGEVSEEVRDQILAAVKFAKTLTPAEKTQILTSLSL